MPGLRGARQVARQAPPDRSRPEDARRRRPLRRSRRAPPGGLDLRHDTMVGAYLLDPARRTYDLVDIAAQRGLAAASKAEEVARWRPARTGGGATARPGCRGPLGLGDRAAPTEGDEGAEDRAPHGRGRNAADRGAGGDGAGRRPARPEAPRRHRRGIRAADRDPPGRDLRARRTRVHDRLAPTARRGPLRRAGPDQEAARQDGLLDRRPRPLPDPRRARDRHQGRAMAGADQAEEHLSRCPSGADRSGQRTAPHDLQPDRDGDRAALEHQPEPAEHPDPHRGGPSDPLLLRGTARPSPALGRLQPDRAADPGPDRRRGCPARDLRPRRGHPRCHRGRDPRLRPKKVSPGERSKAKMVNYGIAYGLSAYGLADRLNIEQDEAGSTSTGTSTASQR